MSTKKLSLIFALILISLGSDCFGAELLVRAKPHWMDDFTQADVNLMSAGIKQSYEARSHIGDIITVRPDGWKWGKEECLPNFIVVKIPAITTEQAKQYEESLFGTSIDDTPPPMIRIRKFAIPETIILTAIKNKQNTITIPKTTFNSQLITKTGDPSEVKPPKTGVSYRLRNKLKPYLMVAYHFWVNEAIAASQLLKTVEEDGNGDYTALETCMNANEQDLTTADKYFDVQICGTDLGGDGWDNYDNTLCTIENYTTDATRYINIYTTASARHNGTAFEVSGLKNYHFGNISGNINGISIYSNFVTINGLEVCHIQALYTVMASGIESGDYIGPTVIANCIVHDIGKQQAGAYGRGIRFYFNHSGSGTIYNTIVYNIAEIGIYILGYGTYANVYNNTVYNYNVSNNNSAGINDAETGNVINNLVIAGVNGGTCILAPNATNTTNGASDTTGTPDGLDNLTTAEFVNVTAGSEDLHLASGATCIDAGTDLGSPYDYDIDGDFRDTYTPWDVGADEYVSAAPPAVLPLVIINNL